MEQLNEELEAGDLKYLVSHIFDIDSYKSKIGEDGDMVVLSFTVDDKAPADDLANCRVWAALATAELRMRCAAPRVKVFCACFWRRAREFGNDLT
jgi:hypothetical protein